MSTWLDPDLTTLAFCWRLTRRDGITLGFTSHDRDVSVNGLVYRAAPGMVPSSVELTSGFDRDSVELAGALTSDAMREEDLIAGRWDGAQLLLFLSDWTAPGVQVQHLVRGELGNVSTADGRFTVDLLGPTHVFDAPVVEETSPGCRAFLGDHRCRVDMAGRSRMTTIQTVESNAITVTAPLVEGVYETGQLRWLDGPNAGLAVMIAVQQGNTLYLSKRPQFAVTAGTQVSLIEGCDGRFSTCTTRFNNAVNFRGEPHLPGNDLLMRYAS
jgi:uncharacterized phage protein (TIGR02218 family)